MTNKLLSLSTEERVQHEADFGGYNDLPPNFRPITEDEFIRSSFFTYCLERYESRQPFGKAHEQFKALLPAGYGYHGLRLFYFNDDSGFAIADLVEHRGTKRRMAFFRFEKCIHQFREPKPEERVKTGYSHMCYSVSICDKCSRVRAIDSSD